MLLGISGKKQSGKNAVANIISNLIAKDSYKDSELFAWVKKQTPEQMASLPFYTEAQYINWKLKSFAGKLKEFISSITGISIEDFENEEIKNKPLGEEWRYWYLKSHKLRTNANPEGAASNRYSTKEEAEEAFRTYEPMINGLTIDTHVPTLREAMQRIGTESMRVVFHPNCWVNALFADYREDSNWCITDVRLPNELKAIEDRGGFVIRVDRPEIVRTDQHYSEVALDQAAFKYRIINNRDFGFLVEEVRRILVTEEII